MGIFMSFSKIHHVALVAQKLTFFQVVSGAPTSLPLGPEHTGRNPGRKYSKVNWPRIGGLERTKLCWQSKWRKDIVFQILREYRGSCLDWPLFFCCLMFGGYPKWILCIWRQEPVNASSSYVWEPWGQHSSVQHDAYHCDDHPGSIPFPTQRPLGKLNWCGTTTSAWNRSITKPCPEECRPKEHRAWIFC